MKIITVIGPSKSGKTELIDYTFKQLSSDGIEIKTKEQIGKRAKRTQDFKSVIKYGNKTIAFFSIGDPADCKPSVDYDHLPSEYILSGLVYASENEADILINAYSESFFNNKTGVSEFSIETYKNLVIVNSNVFVPILMEKKQSRKEREEQIREQFEKIKGEL